MVELSLAIAITGNRATSVHSDSSSDVQQNAKGEVTLLGYSKLTKKASCNTAGIVVILLGYHAIWLATKREDKEGS